MSRRDERIGVIVVNWNSGDFLEPCLRSIARQSLQPARVMIVDNASTDRSLAGLSEKFPHYEVLRQTVNHGFAGGNNVALQKLIDVDWVALLNPDAVARPDWLEKLVAATRQYPTTPAFGSKMLRPNSSILDGTGDVYHVSGLAWRRDHGVDDSHVGRESEEIFSPCGASAFYKRTLLNQLGGFDPRFFCYMEDVDLGFRLRLLGHRARYAPDAIVEHEGSGITGQRSNFSVYYGHRNLIWTFFKNMPASMLYRYLLFHLLVNMAGVVRYTRLGQGRVVLKAKRDALRHLPTVLATRRQIQSNRVVSIPELVRSMSTRMSDLFQRQGSASG